MTSIRAWDDCDAEPGLCVVIEIENRGDAMSGPWREPRRAEAHLSAREARSLRAALDRALRHEGAAPDVGELAEGLEL
jgi:hypothetical protein